MSWITDTQNLKGWCSMKLYEIASEMQDALSLLEGEGEVDMSTLVEYLDQLESEYESKLYWRRWYSWFRVSLGK